jgi:hypothetical protein
MDQVAKHPALARSARSALSRMLGEIYQQLGLAWEFLWLRWSNYTKPLRISPKGSCGVDGT